MDDFFFAKYVDFILAGDIDHMSGQRDMTMTDKGDPFIVILEVIVFGRGDLFRFEIHDKFVKYVRRRQCKLVLNRMVYL